MSIRLSYVVPPCQTGGGIAVQHYLAHMDRADNSRLRDKKPRNLRCVFAPCGPLDTKRPWGHGISLAAPGFQWPHPEVGMELPGRHEDHRVTLPFQWLKDRFESCLQCPSGQGIGERAIRLVPRQGALRSAVSQIRRNGACPNVLQWPQRWRRRARPTPRCAAWQSTRGAGVSPQGICCGGNTR